MILTRYSLAALLSLIGAALAHPGVRDDLRRADERVDREPGSAAAHLRRAALHRRAGDPARSLADAARAAQLGAAPGAVALERGLALAAAGRHAEAIPDLTTAIAARPSWGALVARARCRVARKRPAAAVADFDAALALRPQVDVFLERGRLLQKLGRLDEAASGYRVGLRAVGPATLLADALVDVELARARPELALAVAEAQPEAVRWLLRRAEALDALGDIPRRDASLARALELANRSLARRNTAIHLVARARVHMARGAPDRARADVRAALDKAPRYAAARALAQRLGP